MKTQVQKVTNCIALITLFFFSACSPSQPNEKDHSGSQFASTKIEGLFKEVMVIHDEVMPFISDMKRDKKQLTALLNTTENNPKKTQQIKEAVLLLTQGDSLMFDWMGNFKTPELETPESEALPYLAREKEKITLVSSIMKEAIKKAKAIIATE